MSIFRNIDHSGISLKFVLVEFIAHDKFFFQNVFSFIWEKGQPCLVDLVIYWLLQIRLGGQ